MYYVLDEFSGDEKSFSDKEKAFAHALNVQGVIYQDEKFLKDYSTI